MASQRVSTTTALGAALGAIWLIVNGHKVKFRPGGYRHRTKILSRPDRPENPELRYRTFHELDPPRFKPTLHWKAGAKPISNRVLRRNAYGFYLDMAKAFDCTSMHVLYSELSRYGFDMKSIIALKTIYSKVRLSVKTNKELSEPFATQRGFSQGYPASSLAWSVVYDPVLDDLCRSGLAFCITAGN